MTNNILAMDLRKVNNVLCWYDSPTQRATFRTAKTIPNELRRELRRESIQLVVFHACSQTGSRFRPKV